MLVVMVSKNNIKHYKERTRTSKIDTRRKDSISDLLLGSTLVRVILIQPNIFNLIIANYLLLHIFKTFKDFLHLIDTVFPSHVW